MCGTGLQPSAISFGMGRAIVCNIFTTECKYRLVWVESCFLEHGFNRMRYNYSNWYGSIDCVEQVYNRVQSYRLVRVESCCLEHVYNRVRYNLVRVERLPGPCLQPSAISFGKGQAIVWNLVTTQCDITYSNWQGSNGRLLWIESCFLEHFVTTECDIVHW